MADDAAGLLDHLSIDQAHVVGVSLGGIIGHWLAIRHPERVATLTSIMATTNEPHVGQPDPAVLPALLAVTEPGLEGSIAHQVAVRRAMAGEHFSEDDVRQAAVRAWSTRRGPRTRPTIWPRTSTPRRAPITYRG